jgi:phosphatidylglycerophosphate synthase
MALSPGGAPRRRLVERRALRLTPPNALSLARLAAAPALVTALLLRAPDTAALLFAFAVASDLADGRLARRRGEASAWGGLLDHGADASFASLGLAALALHGVLPATLPLLVALAFAQYVVDSRAHRGGELRGSRLGRWNGIAYFVLLGTVLGRDALGVGWPGDPWLRAGGWALAATTLLSMAERRLRSRGLPRASR